MVRTLETKKYIGWLVIYLPLSHHLLNLWRVGRGRRRLRIKSPVVVSKKPHSLPAWLPSFSIWWQLRRHDHMSALKVCIHLPSLLLFFSSKLLVVQMMKLCPIPIMGMYYVSIAEASCWNPPYTKYSAVIQSLLCLGTGLRQCRKLQRWSSCPRCPSLKWSVPSNGEMLVN